MRWWSAAVPVGGVTAEILTQAGLKVIIVEEGPLRQADDFNMDEATAYADLYQEVAGRRTVDKAIKILQGRAVGGSTTVNWTSSFRTPTQTLVHWADQFGVRGLGEAELAPWFEKMERRLNVSDWLLPPNQNNAILARGAQQLGWHSAAIRRNVNNCANLGYCGMGCPLNAKQSMLVTTIPAALGAGASLITRARVDSITRSGDRVTGVTVSCMDHNGQPRPSPSITINASKVVLAAGSIGTPAVMLRSGLPDPYNVIGARTFLHPVAIVAGFMPQPVRGFSGAPQTVYSDHFLWRDESAHPGFKLEAAPLHPALVSSVMADHGIAHREMMKRFSHFQGSLALMRDGFHPESVGGRVVLDNYGYPRLDYPITDYLWSGLRQGLLAMTELLFAANAKQALPVHMDAALVSNWRQAKTMIEGLSMKPLRGQVFSAHVMGGARMGASPDNSVVDSDGRFHHLDNLYVLDGSLFPTSIGANPQLSIYAIVAKLASRLAGVSGEAVAN